MVGRVGRRGCREVVCICSWEGDGIGAVLMNIDNFLLFWGLGGYGVVVGMECGCGKWGAMRELWRGSMCLQMGEGLGKGGVDGF